VDQYFFGALLVPSTFDGHPEFIPSGCFGHAVVDKHLAGQVKDTEKNRLYHVAIVD
jgi:hypothetical protein